MSPDLSEAVRAGFLVLATPGLDVPARLQGRVIRYSPDASGKARRKAVRAIIILANRTGG